MAQPLFWPGVYFFYPIGNTPAVSLTRDLAPEEHSNILLLGCGDPRNVLYTIYCEPQKRDRKLDFTCCDRDPGILARNVILFTMVADGRPYKFVVWDVYFHVYLSKDSLGVLIEQCKKLLGLSENLQHWNASPYGHFIKMSTEHTLAELRRHWSLYVGMHELPRGRIEAINNTFIEKFKKPSQIKEGSIVMTARSAGPLILNAIPVIAEQFKGYRMTGVTTGDDKDTTAELLNPTLVYSLGGEGCSVHYRTDPLAPFHSAALFGNANVLPSVADVVKDAKEEFSNWCSAFHSSVLSPVSTVPVIRLILGDAMAVCRTFQVFAATGTLNAGIPIAQWKTQVVELNKDEYVSGGAPAIFDVIDTSNLIDNIGLLNVIIAAIPLLLAPPQSGVLYTESLVLRGEDATQEFKAQLQADITVVGLLLGICPVDYLSGFATRSNTHELMLHLSLAGGAPQFHQVTTWKYSISGDVVAFKEGGIHQPLTFDPRQLGTFFYDMYNELFIQEDFTQFARLNKGNMLRAIGRSNIVHYMRETFCLFLKLVKDRLDISEGQWEEVMVRFFVLREADQSLRTSIEANNFQDFCGQLHRHGVYTMGLICIPLPKIGRFSNWDILPILVRLILIVPREKLDVLEDPANPSMPLLQCDIRGTWSHNIFTAVQVAFGRVISKGTNARPMVVIEEDPKGWEGSSSLVASFTIPTAFLISVEPMEDLNVRFSVRSTPASAHLAEKIGKQFILFSAKLTDSSHVYIVPEQPLPSKKSQFLLRTPSPSTNIGEMGAVHVELDEQCELASSMTAKVTIEDEEVKRLFRSGVMPQITQVSPCVMKIVIDTHTQNVVYPFPGIGSECKIRLARKSLCIEIDLPVWGPFKKDGMKLNPFSVIGIDRVLRLWSIHRVNLSCLPVLDINAGNVRQWLDPHVGSMMSTRERSIRKKNQSDVLMFVKDTLHTIFIRSSGIQGGPSQRLFALRDTASNNCDTVFFISDLRFDLQSHTLVCDGYVLPLTNNLLSKIIPLFAKLVREGNIVYVPTFEGEVRAWKQLLPALVERCRTSWHHTENCEYESQGSIPLTEAREADPLCSCGKGKDVEGMLKVGLWKKLAPYVTRIALSPLFAVTYLEAVCRDPAAHKCFVCRGKGKPRLKTCAACKKVRYCSEECQKKDWKIHKTQCRSSVKGRS